MEGHDEKRRQGASDLQPLRVASGAPDEGRPDALFAEARGALLRGDRRHARASVESLVRALEVHFALEDRVYFPALCALQPSVGPEIRQLQREHGELRDQLATIAGHLEQPQDPSALARSFEDLVTDFLGHEAREEAILVAVESGMIDGDGATPRVS